MRICGIKKNPDNVFLAIATNNISVLLMTYFVVQGPICCLNKLKIIH